MSSMGGAVRDNRNERTPMSRNPLRVLLLIVAFAALLVVAGCGNSGGDKAQKGGGETGAKQGQKKGGTLNVLQNSDFDNIDPGIAYYNVSYMWLTAAHKTLYQYEPGETQKPTPDLADGDPMISTDKKTVTVKLKKGQRFSPPVNREIQAKDIKYAMERGFTKQVATGYIGSYFGDIVGPPKAPGNYKPIAGIQTPDPYTIVFKLSKPTAAALASALVMTVTAPVPQEYAQKYDKKNPSQYGQYQVTSGPYMLQHDKSGKTT